VIGAALAAQESPTPARLDPGATGLVALRQACIDATTDGLVLNIAAHPDDEAARTLVFLRRAHGLRTLTVYSTYGDGGQNAIGREIGPELAGLRVRETLAAAEHTGVQVGWLGFSDFGFSKTLDETLAVWGRDELLRRMAAQVRAAQPDLVVTNHSLTRGHGHHRASRWAVEQALVAWSELRGRPVPLYERSSLENQHVEVDPNQLDPVAGETFSRQAHRGYIEHATQGPWRPHDPLRVRKDRWRQVWPSLDDDPEAEAAWLGDVGSAFASPAVQAALQARGFEAEEIEARMRAFGAERAAADCVAAAVPLLQLLRGVERELVEAESGSETETGEALVRVRRRIDALQRIVLFGSGLAIEAWMPDDVIAGGGGGDAFVALHGGADLPDGVRRWGASHGANRGVSAVNGVADEDARVLRVPFAAAAEEALDGDASASPEPEWIDLVVDVDVAGVPLRFVRSLPYTSVPPLQVRWDRAEALVPEGVSGERVFSLSVVWHGEGILEAPLRLGMGVGVVAQAIPPRLTLSPEHREARVLVRVAFDGAELSGPARIRASVGEHGAVLRLVPAALELDPELSVAIVRGPDDTLLRTMQDLGIHVTELDEASLGVAELSAYDTLVLDIRAYHHRRELAEHRERMLQFCRSGGRVLAFYHKPSEWNEGPGHPLLAPFPMEVGNTRVTEEDAAVVPLVPEHPLWTRPHRLGAADFDGWVQERGLNFPSRWDAAWTPLIAMRDSGEETDLTGALLHTRYGRGDYVYCSLALYRQLRNNHLGAARMLVNLLTP